MWVLVMFDLPVDDKKARRDYARFRNAIMNDGFMMLQFSVYARPCPSEENAKVHLKRVEEAVPPEGEVRAIMLTDMQYSRMKIYIGKKRKEPEKQPQQLSFF